MPFDALIFDLDGTLWDAAAASTYGWNLALEKLGLSSRVTVDDIRSVSGKPFEQCVATLLPELHPADAATIELLDGFERLGIEKFGGVLYDGVADGLARLAARYRLFVVSNCPDWYLEAFFGFSGLGEHFSGWDCHGASGMDKSSMLRALCEKYGLERTVYVSDTRGDRLSAEKAGVEFAFVGYGFGEAGEASPAFESFAELLEAFLI
ncbi:MAG: HAD family hydrolase [Actinobacteria bacterium]|nr:HAD family hydrolase [Actinomycetota bacterium]